MTLPEIFRLQGMDHTQIKQAVSAKDMGEQLGNSMSLNVLERLLFQIFKVAEIPVKLTDSDMFDNVHLSDSWQNGTALIRLCSSKGKHIKPEEPAARALERTPTLESSPWKDLRDPSWTFHHSGSSSPRSTQASGGRIHVTMSHVRRSFIVDSGASFHLMDACNLTEQEQATIRPIDPPLELNTAKGTTTSYDQADVYVEQLKEKLTFILLPESPSVVSLGRLATRNGFGYHWPAGEHTSYLEKNGVRINCTPNYDVPFLIPASSSSSHNWFPSTTPNPGGEDQEEAGFLDGP